MNLVLDSSVFISYLNKDDVLHKATNQLIQFLLNKQKFIIIIPVIVFLEVANVLARKKRDFIEDYMLSVFQKYQVVDIDLHFARSLLPLFKQITLKTSDAIILGTAILNKATLITWDEKFQKQAKTFVEVQTPKGFLDSKNS